MDITDKIKQLRFEQLEHIIKARRAAPFTEFISVNAKARSACALRHPGWMEEFRRFSNAAIEASVRAKLNNALSTATVTSAFESMSLGIMAKEDLTLEEYDLIISPVASFFPELIVLEQDWTPVPMDNTSRYQPFRQYGAPPAETSGISATKKTRTFRRTEDHLEEKAAEAAFDPNDFLAALKPKIAEPKKMTKEEALQAMLTTMKPKPEPLPQMMNKPVGMTEQELEDGLLAMPVASPSPEPKKLTPEEMIRMMQSKKV